MAIHCTGQTPGLPRCARNDSPLTPSSRGRRPWRSTAPDKPLDCRAALAMTAPPNPVIARPQAVAIHYTRQTPGLPRFARNDGTPTPSSRGRRPWRSTSPDKPMDCRAALAMTSTPTPSSRGRRPWRSTTPNKPLDCRAALAMTAPHPVIARPQAVAIHLKPKI